MLNNSPLFSQAPVRQNTGEPGWLICRHGVDGEPAEAYAKFDPSTMPMRKWQEVPGAAESVESLFDVAQALAWIAKERNDIEERLAWRAGIPELLKELLH